MARGLPKESCSGSCIPFVRLPPASVGDLELAISRDRNGSFTPRLVPKGSRPVGGLDDMIVSLYAGGMTICDIEHHLVSTIGTEISRETISKITDEVLDEVMAWQQRPFEAFYPVIYLDAIIVRSVMAQFSALLKLVSPKVPTSPHDAKCLTAGQGCPPWYTHEGNL